MIRDLLIVHRIGATSTSTSELPMSIWKLSRSFVRPRNIPRMSNGFVSVALSARGLAHPAQVDSNDIPLSERGPYSWLLVYPTPEI